MTHRRSGAAGALFLGSAGGEGRVEGRIRWAEGKAAHELQRLRSPDEPVRARILPLDGEGALVADRVEHPDRVLPRHVPAPGGDEVPTAPRVGPRQVGTEPPIAPVHEPAFRI